MSYHLFLFIGGRQHSYSWCLLEKEFSFCQVEMTKRCVFRNEKYFNFYKIFKNSENKGKIDIL